MKEVIRVEKVALPKPELDDGEEDEEEEEEEIKHREVEKVTLLGVVQLDALLGITSAGQVLRSQKGSSKDQSKKKTTTTTLEVQFIVETSGGLKVGVKEVGEGGASASLVVLGLSYCIYILFGSS